MEWIELHTENDRLPELKDANVLGHFENGSIETIHIEDMFRDITNGLDKDGKQLYTKWYLHNKPKITHWMPLPEPPTKH